MTTGRHKSGSPGEDVEASPPPSPPPHPLHHHEKMAIVMTRILTGESGPDRQGQEHQASEVPAAKRARVRRTRASSESSGSEGEDQQEAGTRHKPKQKRLSRQDVVKQCHALPEDTGLERERQLQRIATRGVVQLFNAVSTQQKDLEAKLKEAGPSERKKTKVLSSIDKESFIDMLKGSGKAQKHRPRSNKEEKEGPSWGVLRGDYMMHSKMRDWDKKGGDEEEGEEGGAMLDSESDSDT